MYFKHKRQCPFPGSRERMLIWTNCPYNFFFNPAIPLTIFLHQIEPAENITGLCNDAGSYCGIRDRKYPDRRSMGYPFDRMPRTGVDTLQDFLTPNMRVIDCSITFNNRTEQRANNLGA